MPLGGMQVKRAYHYDLRIVGKAEVGQKRSYGKLGGLVMESRLVGSDLRAWHQFSTD